jgi:methyl-accepting chemotaxis protein
MQHRIWHFSSWGIGAKLTLILTLVVGIVLLSAIELMIYNITEQVQKQATVDLTAKTNMVVNMLEIFDKQSRSQVEDYQRVFKSSFKDAFELDTVASSDVAGAPAPVLKTNGVALNGNFAAADQFTSTTGGIATIFVKKDSDFIRISTSLKKQNGERAIGTALDHASPAFASINEGKSFVGVATLFGKQYMTQYDPIKDKSGKVIGILFVGLDFTDSIKELKDQIRSMTIGKSGYYYALDAREGETRGNLFIHPTKEGQSILNTKDSAGHYFVKDMLEQKQGVTRYPWINSERGETVAREKIAAFAPMKSWNWVIAGSVYADEYTEAASHLAHLCELISIVIFAMMGVGLYFTLRRYLSKPLSLATEAAIKLSHGDLTLSIETKRMDEIGQLMRAIDGIGKGLATVVTAVRESTASIATSSGEIASENANLSARTESQASSLEETAASVEQLTSTVKQNADNAHQANQLAELASTVAGKGGAVVLQVVETMGSINESSRKIADIISVIDAIAFQTNILALNAAVEAARAGEQGRGFAVVAAEVRVLAQRSAGAAKEIKTLITDSVEKVDLGSKLADRAGSTMNEVVTSVKRVTEIINEITVASNEQTSGIEQINQAIIEIDNMTQQNAILVQHAAESARSMHEQAETLVEAVSVFKLDAVTN